MSSVSKAWVVIFFSYAKCEYTIHMISTHQLKGEYWPGRASVSVSAVSRSL